DLLHPLLDTALQARPLVAGEVEASLIADVRDELLELRISLLLGHLLLLGRSQGHCDRAGDAFDHRPEGDRMLLELVRLRLEVPPRARLVLEALGELAHQDDALLEQPEARPDRGLDGVPLLRSKALGRVLVADTAAKGDDVVIFRAPDRAAALRAREAGRLA